LLFILFLTKTALPIFLVVFYVEFDTFVADVVRQVRLVMVSFRVQN
jgi:hypothetical protein